MLLRERKVLRKRDWVYVLGIIPLLVLFDQLTKFWALSTITQYQTYGPVGLSLYSNPGVFLGMFSKVPPLLRIVSLSTGGGFLAFLYIAIQYLIPRRSLLLRMGMSLLLAGVFGNIIDRIVKGAVVDFLFFLLPGGHTTPIFNIADFVQWIGYFMIVVFVLRYAEKIWPSKDDRKKIWINPIFQRKYILIFLSVGLGFSIMIGIYSYTFLKIVVGDFLGSNPGVRVAEISKSYLSVYLSVFLVICVAFLISLFLIARLLSHRMAGPLYAFQNFLENLLKGVDRPLRLRAGDEFNHLEELAQKIRNEWKGKIRGLNSGKEKKDLKLKSRNKKQKKRPLKKTSPISRFSNISNLRGRKKKKA